MRAKLTSTRHLQGRFWYLGAALASILFFWVACAGGHIELSLPFSYSGDTLGMLMVIKGMLRGEWFPYLGIQIPSAGAPFGLDLGDYPVPEQLHLLLMKLLSLINSDPIWVLNTYFLLSFPLVTVAFVFACRQFRIKYATAIACGLLFSFLPFHLLRYSHVFYFPYFMLPLYVLLCLWMWSKKPTFFKGNTTKGFRLDLTSRKAKISLLVAVLAGGLGIYYAFFFCALLLLSGLAAVRYRRNSRHLIGALLIIGAVGASSALTCIPNIVYKMKHGENLEVARRGTIDAEYHGLKLTNILTPRSGNPFSFLKRIKGRYRSGTPLSEGAEESLAFIGIIAFFALLYRFLTAVERRTIFDRLGLLLVGGVLLGTMGGLGAMFALMVSPMIRCYNRISILIAAVAYLGCAFWITSIGRRKGPRTELVLALALLSFGLYEESTQDYKNVWASTRDEYLSDKNFFHEIEAAGPKVGGMILQLPFLAYPEAGSVHNLRDYSHFRANILTDKTRWSFGAMKGRPESDRIQAWSKIPVDLEEVRKAGYTGIYLDRNGFVDNGKAVESDLQNRLKTIPIVSSNGRLVFFELK